MQDDVSDKVYELRRRMGLLAWDVKNISDKELLVRKHTELRRLEQQLRELDHDHLD